MLLRDVFGSDFRPSSQRRVVNSRSRRIASQTHRRSGVPSSTASRSDGSSAGVVGLRPPPSPQRRIGDLQDQSERSSTTPWTRDDSSASRRWLVGSDSSGVLDEWTTMGSFSEGCPLAASARESPLYSSGSQPSLASEAPYQLIDANATTHRCDSCKAFVSRRVVSGDPPPSLASQRLAGLSENCAPDPEAIAECVRMGAEVFFWPAELEHPVLHLLVKKDLVQCVAACLRVRPKFRDVRARSLDFTVQDDWGNTVLHHICAFKTSKVAVAELLNVFLDCFEAHPEDRVDWSQRNDHTEDFLTVAAYWGLLSVVWPILKRRRVAYFRYFGRTKAQIQTEMERLKGRREGKGGRSSSPEVFSGSEPQRLRAKPIPLRCRVHRRDWAQLSERDQRDFLRNA